MYGATKDTKRLKKSRQDLKWLYSQMPDTKGCMEHISKPESEGGCGAWCCQSQTPQVLYSEFLNTWTYVTHNWKDDQIIDLIGRCIRAYLFGRKERACVFWDKQTKMCLQHASRPYNCRIYGITPEEEFKPRYERLKVIYPNIKPQCNLVSTVDGCQVTTKDTDRWWKSLNAIEMSIGICSNKINDELGGSYRTYHDHVLLHLLGEEGMSQLSKVREGGELMVKENTYRNMMESVNSFREKLWGNNGS